MAVFYFSEVSLKQLILLIITGYLFFSSAVAQEEQQETKQEEQQNSAPATDSSKDRKISPPVSLIEQFQSDIERSISKDLLSPMLAGTEDFLTITQPDSHQADRGVAILVPEWSQAATDPKAINFLRQHLPHEGWTTITLQPLTKPLNYPAQAERTETAQEENQKLLEEYQTKLAAIMTAVMEKAADFPGIFLVIAQGNNAAMLIDLYQQEKVEKPNALVTLSTYLLTEADNKALANKMAESEIPTLDLVLKKDVLWVQHFAKTRKTTAKKTMKTYYRQRELTNFRAGYYPLETLAKEIKGWVTTIGW